MTIRALPQGIYHHRVRPDGTTDEHLVPYDGGGRARDFGAGIALYCAPCDAITWVYREGDSEQRREVEAAIADGRLRVVDEKPIDIGPRGITLAVLDHDALRWAREDGDKRIQADLHVVRVTGQLLPDHIARRAFVRSLRVP